MRTKIQSIVLTAGLGLGVFVACGSDEGSVAPPGDDGGASTSTSSSGFTGDGSPDGNTSPCGDTTSDPANCGQCGSVCAAGKTCVSSACACPAYTGDCGGGTCKPVVSDPNNCGACGTVCTPPKVCAGTGCADACLPGTKDCSGACVDTDSSNDHCGACGTKCAANEGCVNGTCRPTTALKPGPNNCVGGGPPINIGTGQATDPCSGALATKTFTWALCSCTSVKIGGKTIIDAFDSTKGGYQANGIGGGLGFNGTLEAPAEFDIYGTMWSSDTGGWTNNAGNSSVMYDLHTNGNIKTASFLVGNDARVNGNIEGTPFTITKTLTISPGKTQSQVTAMNTVEAAVTVPPACACEPKDILDIGAIVAARATKNDNATIGLDPAALDKKTHTRLDLPCGHYYLNTIDLINGATIVAHGRTALYIGGDIKAGAALTIVPEIGAELDILVGGTISAPSAIKLGSTNYPALTRVYVAGTQLQLSGGGVNIGANIYAPNAAFLWESTSHIYGSVFAKSFFTNSPLNIHYDKAVINSFTTCPPPPGSTPDGGASSSGGSSGTPGPSGCGSCRDCNNQACINGSCGDCTDSSQCCAPLVCVSGSCVSPVN